MLRAIPGLYPADTSSIPPVSCDNQHCLQILTNAPEGGTQNCPWLRAVELDLLFIPLKPESHIQALSEFSHAGFSDV